MNRRLIDITEEELRKILREEKGKDEIVLTEKEMEGKTLSMAEAAKWIGVSWKTIWDWERKKEIALTKGRRVPFTEVVRKMKSRAA